MKTDKALAKEYLPLVRECFENLDDWSEKGVHDALNALIAKLGCKNGQIFWPVRVALSGLASTPGGATEIAELLGKEKSLERLDFGIKLLGKE